MGGVLALRVVVKVDVGKESVLAQVRSGKATLEHLGFEGAGEGLSPCIVVGIGAGPRGRHHCRIGFHDNGERWPSSAWGSSRWLAPWLE